MSVWSAVKGLFGSSENADKVVDGVISAADALVFTDEEKSAVNMKAMELRIRFAEATTGSRLARRYLALMVTGTYLTWFSVAGLLVLFDQHDKAQRIGDLLTSLAVGGSFSVIISWYFMSGLVRK